jgi:hypothetical protein
MTLDGNCRLIIFSVCVCVCVCVCVSVFMYEYNRTSSYELSTNEKLVFTNIARTNELLLSIHLTNPEPRAYEHNNKLTLTNLTIYLMKRKLIQLINIQLTNPHYVCKLGFACIMFQREVRGMVEEQVKMGNRRSEILYFSENRASFH